MPGVTVVVRSHGKSPVDYPITETTLHPGYDALEHDWKMVSLAKSFDFVPGYDVALLTVDVGETPLAESLVVADQATLNALRPGQSIFLIGYPMEGLAELDVSAPEPETQSGNITSVTNFSVPAWMPMRRSSSSTRSRSRAVRAAVRSSTDKAASWRC